MEYENLCKKGYLQKHKLSEKHINHMVFTPYMEACDCCGKIEKLVEYIEEEEDER